MSANLRRMSESRLSKQGKAKSRRSLDCKHLTLGKSCKVHPLSDESVSNGPLKSTDSLPQKEFRVTAQTLSHSPADKPTNQPSKPIAAVVPAVSTEQQNLHTEVETPPSNIFNVTAKALDVEIVPTPGPGSPHSTADTHTGQLSKSTAVVFPALSAEQQHIWNKAKQALEERE